MNSAKRLEAFLMLTRKIPCAEEFPAPQQSIGLHLEVEHPEKGSIKLDLSETVALILIPCLLGLTFVSGGMWLWFNYIPHPPMTLPAATETQPKK